VRDVAVPALVKAYERDEKRLEILQALKTIDDRRAIPVFRQALEFVPGVNDANARVAAEMLGKFGDKEAVDPIMKGLAKVGGTGPDPTTTRRIFITALGKIRDPRAVPTLVEIASQELTRDTVKAVAAAANALGEMRDPRGVRPLIKLLFGVPPVDAIARVALVKIGPPAIEPLAQVFKGEDKDMIAWAEKIPNFNLNNLPMAAAVPLGHIGDKAAVPVLLSRIGEKGDAGNRIRVNASTSLAILGDAEAVEPLTKVMQLSGYPDDQVPIAQALAAIGDKRAVAPLVEAASKGLIKKASGDLVHFFRWNAGLALARLVDDEDAPQYEQLVEKEQHAVTKKYFEEYRPRVKAALECKKDVGCWTKKLKDTDWRVQEKAAYMLARLGDKKVLPALLEQLNHRQEETRRAVLLALDRLADKSCQPCIAKLEAQIEADKTDSKFKGSVVYDEASLLERIRRK
jgi:HEAT repeat protein